MQIVIKIFTTIVKEIENKNKAFNYTQFVKQCKMDKTHEYFRKALIRFIVKDLRIPFQNRINEIHKILHELSNGDVHIVFGPKGCGKTTLSHALQYLSKELNDHAVIYIGYGKSRSEIMSGLSDLILNFKDYLIKELKHAIQELSTNRISIGPILTISELIYLVSKFLKDRKRKTILIIDEFRRIGKLSEVEQELELVSNDVAVIDYGFKKHGGSFKIICFTSDAIAQKLQPKLSSKCVWWIMWHLPKEDFYKALRELNCSIDYELLWKLTGGFQFG